MYEETNRWNIEQRSLLESYENTGVCKILLSIFQHKTML